ncbi:pentapeptide repeat-containing protein [Helicobacter pullorum]|uniref:Membrane protein n=1 Tax=Helicobacter pullorum TaxID=35818 RepID=A0A377PYB5_9HELI|nr:pentapeptide repeat-containing protein [Helicobacter pullorum]STQ87625.1 membrane protein [Helicobacter pullorum]
MSITIDDLNFYALNTKETLNLWHFFKSLIKDDSNDIRIETNENNEKFIVVNREIYLDFSKINHDFKDLDFYNIKCLKKITLLNASEASISFQNSTICDTISICGYKNVTLNLKGINNFLKDFNISGSNFKNIGINSHLKGDGRIIFQGCSFEDFNTIGYTKVNIHNEFILKFCTFKGKSYFANLIFKNKINFEQSKFQDIAYFKETIFKDYADFSQCEFEKTANFYGAKFEKVPNFSQVQFKGSLNAVNMDLDFGFETLREKIKAEHELSKQQAAPRAGKVLELQFHKSLASIANDFRDSFRIFKNALIKENNNLDASEFHKLELYCKEIELGESPNKRGIQAQSEEDVRKNTKPFKESIDWFLLRFYRKLSEHHTDLLRVLNNLVLLIALYAGFVYIGNFKIGDAKTSSISQQLFQHIEAFQNYIKNLSVVQEYSLVLIILLILFVAFAIYLVFKLKLLIHIKTTFKIILAGIMKNFWLLLKILSVILSIFCIITFIVLQFETNNRSSILVNIFGFCLFIILYLWLVCLDSIFLRYIVVIIAYIVASVALGDNIAILNPLLGKLISNKEPINDPLFTAITLAYTILTLLVLFSLQKTARKNSIVPS